MSPPDNFETIHTEASFDHSFAFVFGVYKGSHPFFSHLSLLSSPCVYIANIIISYSLPYLLQLLQD